MLKLTQENQIMDLPDLNRFQIGDEVVVDASADNDRFEGVIIGIELRRVHGSNHLVPSITLLHDGYITDEFKPIDCRKVSPPAPETRRQIHEARAKGHASGWRHALDAAISQATEVLGDLIVANETNLQEAHERLVEKLTGLYDHDPNPEDQAAGDEPLFWYRPVGEDGGYEGPHHALSVEFAAIPAEKRRQWKPLYPMAQAPVLSCGPTYLDFITPDEIFDKGPAAVEKWQEAKRVDLQPRGPSSQNKRNEGAT